MPNVNLALMHYPVVEKHGQVIASAVTNLDLHDIARVARTYDVQRFYVVTPLEDQQKLVTEIVEHWVSGYGATYNPKRREALELIQLENDFEGVLASIRSMGQGEPKTIATSARPNVGAIGYEKMRGMMRCDDGPYLLVLGTAWGLAEEIVEKADFVLSPIKGRGPYNHLSVRSAASIILDRLVGEEF